MSAPITSPDFSAALTALVSYSERSAATATSEHREIVREVRRRLERLQRQANDLVALNNQIWAKQGLSVTLESEADSDTIVFRFGELEQRLKVNRADPQKPVSIRQLTAGAFYNAGQPEPMDDEEAALQLELEEKLEAFYQSAHRILKLFGRIPALRKIRCTPISRVRNELIEHPKDGALYSFGVGSSGPRVKPSTRGTPTFTDEGILPNAAALVKAIVTVCAAAP